MSFYRISEEPPLGTLLTSCGGHVGPWQIAQLRQHTVAPIVTACRNQEVVREQWDPPTQIHKPLQKKALCFYCRPPFDISKLRSPACVKPADVGNTDRKPP